MAERQLQLTSVVGYLFEPSQYVKFDEAMEALLKKHELCYFRTAECFHLTDQFAKYDRSSKEPEEIDRAVIRLIRRHAMLGVGAEVSEARYQLLKPKLRETLMGSAYRMLCQWCLRAIGDWAKKHTLKGKIVYNFEAGCSMQSDANRDLNMIATLPRFRQAYLYGGHGFYPKDKMRGLQAADLLAWFYRHEAEDLLKTPIGHESREGRRRRDFRLLIGSTRTEQLAIKHVFKYFDANSLIRFFSNADNSDPLMR